MNQILESIYCDNCGEIIMKEEGRDIFYCKNCGSKYVIAKIKEA